jgi:hypothetical protein
VICEDNKTVVFKVNNSNRLVIIDKNDKEKVGQYLWYIGNSGYAYAMTPWEGGKRKTLILHNFIMDTGPNSLDHINHNPLDNRRANLREATHEQNTWNKPKFKKSWKGIPCSSKYKGVSYHKRYGHWEVNIICKGIRYWLGKFHCEKEAARAYDKEAKKLFGEFAHINFPEVD